MSMLLDEPELGLAFEDSPDLPERYEVVQGEVVELPEMSFYANRVAGMFNRAVTRFLLQHDVGDTDIETLFHIPQSNDRGRNRRPDWAYVSYDRWPQNRPFPYRGNARDVVPDIVAEIVSPGDSADDLIAKAREYLQGGVRLVWIVYPLAKEVHAYLPGSSSIRVYFASDELDAGEILPGFRTPVAPLFPPLDPETLPPGAGD